MDFVFDRVVNNVGGGNADYQPFLFISHDVFKNLLFQDLKKVMKIKESSPKGKKTVWEK